MLSIFRKTLHIFITSITNIMKIKASIFYVLVLFGISLQAQHAREGWVASVQGGTLNNDPCNCAPTPCFCDRLTIPYDNDNNITGSPENAANTPKGLTNSGYILIFEDEFTSTINYPSISTIGSNGNWNNKRWLTSNTPSGGVPTNCVAANVASYPSFFSTINETSGSDKILNLKADKLILPDGSTQLVMSEIQSALHYRYGYMEARIQIPKGEGLLPAFWTFAASSPCASNNSYYTMYEEFDDFEYFEKDISFSSRPRSYQKPVIHQHYKPNGPCGPINSIEWHIVPMDDAGVGAYFLDMSADFFIYGMDSNRNILLY